MEKVRVSRRNMSARYKAEFRDIVSAFTCLESTAATLLRLALGSLFVGGVQSPCILPALASLLSRYTKGNGKTSRFIQNASVSMEMTLALASRSYFSSVRSSTMPLRNRMWPLIVLLPASTCPMNTTLTCFLILGATAEGSARSQNALTKPANRIKIPPATATSSSSSNPERSSEFRFK